MDFIGKDGFGNCEKEFEGMVVCYVNEPTTCPDVFSSRHEPGKLYSMEACKKGYKLILSLYNFSYFIRN